MIEIVETYTDKRKQKREKKRGKDKIKYEKEK